MPNAQKSQKSKKSQKSTRHTNTAAEAGSCSPPPASPEAADADHAAREAFLRELQRRNAPRKAKLAVCREQMLAAEAARPCTEFEKWEESQRPVYPSDREPPERDLEADADTAQLILFGMTRASGRFLLPAGVEKPRYVIQAADHRDTRWFNKDGNPIPVVQSQKAQAKAGDAE
jgi:hypothetical protein